MISYLEKNFPQLVDLAKMTHVCSGAFNKDWIVIKDISPSEILPFIELLTKAEELIEANLSTTFGEIWKDMPDDLSTINKETIIVEYAIFPEDYDWQLFLKKFPEFEILDEALYLLWEGELGHAFSVVIPKEALNYL
jgi:hypothetical protein